MRLGAPGCKGNLVPVHVHSQGLGRTFSITCCCDGCAMNAVVFDTCMNNEKLCGNTNAVGMCVQIAFIINPRCACAARVAVLGLCLSVGQSVTTFSATTRNKPADKRHQWVQHYMAIFVKSAAFESYGVKTK